MRREDKRKGKKRKGRRVVSFSIRQNKKAGISMSDETLCRKMVMVCTLHSDYSAVIFN